MSRFIIKLVIMIKKQISRAHVELKGIYENTMEHSIWYFSPLCRQTNVIWHIWPIWRTTIWKIIWNIN